MTDERPDVRSANQIDELIEKSSFGTAGARRLRSRTSGEITNVIARRVTDSAPTREMAPAELGRRHLRVFISYAHESDAHDAVVRNLHAFLRSCGIDARMDVDVAPQRRDWPLWLADQIREADHILIVASAAYRARVQGGSGRGAGRGVQWEVRLIRDAVYRDRGALDRFVPVVVPGQSLDGVPDFLMPATRNVYYVRDFTAAGAEPLLRLLTDRAVQTTPPLDVAPMVECHRSIAGTSGDRFGEVRAGGVPPMAYGIPGSATPALSRHRADRSTITGTPVELRLLGPLELVVGRRMLKIGGPRQRVVLSMLAINANRVTSVDELVEALWGTDPPSTARAQIQTCVSSLRRLITDAGCPGGIRTRPPGYLLEIAPSDLDTEAFGELVGAARNHTDEGRIATAAATLRQALNLWRGPALADVTSDLVKRRAAQYEDQRIAAIEERIRLDLALGAHEEIIGELAALVACYPFRERLAGFHMLALYRSGRQADALSFCGRFRNALAEELGIEPGHELRQLKNAILNRDPGLDLPAASTSAQTASPPAWSESKRSHQIDEPGRTTDCSTDLRETLVCGGWLIR